MNNGSFRSQIGNGCSYVGFSFNAYFTSCFAYVKVHENTCSQTTYECCLVTLSFQEALCHRSKRTAN